jgi:hypothetical protein
MVVGTIEVEFSPESKKTITELRALVDRWEVLLARLANVGATLSQPSFPPYANPPVLPLFDITCNASADEPSTALDRPIIDGGTL